MDAKNAVRRTLIAVGAVASLLALPRAALADHDAAARAAAASDPQYSAGYLTSWNALHKMKPMDVMHLVDADKKGYVTLEQFMKFQEELFQRIDRNHDGKIDADEWMGAGSQKAAPKASMK
jgi:hypothetical protein